MKTIFLIFCLFLSAPVWSQTVGVEVLVTTNRMLSRLDELEELANSSQLIIRLRNSTALRQNVQLEMHLTSPQTQFSIHTNPNAAPSFFPVNAFDTRTLTVSDLNELFDQNSFELGDGRTLAEFLAADPTGQVPSGQYRLCVRVAPQSLTPPQPKSFQSEGCTNITFQQFNPPVISLINNYPYSEGAAVPPLRNPNAPFPITVTPPISLITNPVNVLFKYTLCLIELFENDQRDPNQVLRAVIDGKEPRGIVVRKEILNSPAGQAQITVNLLPVDFSAPLQLAQNYAVAVLAELQGATTAELPNGGLSPICHFQYGQRFVINRPFTGRKGLDTFIKILNKLDSPNKSATELLLESYAELAKSNVTMKANKACYSTPNAVNCIKLDSLYDVKYPNLGARNFIKLLTNDVADDMGTGDAFNVCVSGNDGLVKGFNLQRVGSLTAGLSAFIQKPQAQDITDRMASACGVSMDGGGNDPASDDSKDGQLNGIFKNSSVDQLNPYVQYLNELFAGCSPSGKNGMPDSGNSAIAGDQDQSRVDQDQSKDPDKEEEQPVENGEQSIEEQSRKLGEGLQSEMPAQNGFGVVDIASMTSSGVDYVNMMRGVPTSPFAMAYALLNFTRTVTSAAGEIPSEPHVVGKMSQGISFGTDVAMTVEAGIGIEAAVAAGGLAAAGAYFGLIVGIMAISTQLIEANIAVKMSQQPNKREENGKFYKHGGGMLTLDVPNTSFEKQQEKKYELLERFGRLGWVDVFGSGGSSNQSPVVGNGLNAGKELTGFACRMVAKCNQDGWGSSQCRGFLNTFNCKGDSRIMYMDPDAFAGCGAPPFKSKYGCTEKMIGQSNPNNLDDPCAKIAANRALLAKILARGRDPRYTDPVNPNSGIDIPSGGGKKGPDPRLNPQSTNNPQPVLGGQSSPTTPANTIPKPAIDKPAVPKPSTIKSNRPGQNPDPNKNHTNR